MGPCTCGHAPEDHEPECSECPCVHYEDAWGEEDPGEAAWHAWAVGNGYHP